MPEQEKQSALERNWMMILTLLGFLGMAVWGFVKYGSSIGMWPSMHFWVTLIIGGWFLLDLVNFFRRRSQR